MQQFAYTTGKNSTDSALIIDAMDLLYAGNVDGFVIVSSDSDFTRLATRLRESGMTVYGVGQSKTPKPFQDACDQFIFLELLRSEPAAEPSAAAEPVSEAAPVKDTQAAQQGQVQLVIARRDDRDDRASTAELFQCLVADQTAWLRAHDALLARCGGALGCSEGQALWARTYR